MALLPGSSSAAASRHAGGVLLALQHQLCYDWQCVVLLELSQAG